MIEVRILVSAPPRPTIGETETLLNVLEQVEAAFECDQRDRDLSVSLELFVPGEITTHTAE